MILLKFLRAMDFKVKDALSMLRNTVRWRKEFGIEGLIEEYLGNDWDKVVFSHGHDKEGHPVYYNVFDEFEDKELYNKDCSTLNESESSEEESKGKESLNSSRKKVETEDTVRQKI